MELKLMSNQASVQVLICNEQSVFLFLFSPRDLLDAQFWGCFIKTIVVGWVLVFGTLAPPPPQYKITISQDVRVFWKVPKTGGY
jgi:hypothetical protein